MNLENKRDLKDWCKTVLTPYAADFYNLLPAKKDDRRFQAFCLGTPRSGTHSIAYIFSKSYNTAHEPLAIQTMVQILRWKKKQIHDHQLISLLKARDRFLSLEMDASHFLHHTAPILSEIFPASKFILTIRDPFSWIKSEINKNVLTSKLKHKNRKVWMAMQDYRYARYKINFPVEESSLSEISGVYPLGSYLSYWNQHNKTLLSCLPEERLLIIKTRDIRSSSEVLSNFLGIPGQNLDLSKSKSDSSENYTFDVNQYVGKRYIEEVIMKYCDPLLLSHFS